MSVMCAVERFEGIKRYFIILNSILIISMYFTLLEREILLDFVFVVKLWDLNLTADETFAASNTQTRKERYHKLRIKPNHE